MEDVWQAIMAEDRKKSDPAYQKEDHGAWKQKHPERRAKFYDEHMRGGKNVAPPTPQSDAEAFYWERMAPYWEDDSQPHNSRRAEAFEYMKEATKDRYGSDVEVDWGAAQRVAERQLYDMLYEGGTGEKYSDNSLRPL